MQYSIVNFSDVMASSDLRIDGDYWHPEFIRNSLLVKNNESVGNFVKANISNIKSSPIKEDFEYLEISGITSSNYETKKVKQGEEPDRAHYILKKNDVAVSTVRPNRNAVAFIQEDNLIGSSGLSILRAKNVEAEYLFAFCKTDYFRKSLMRANKATMYPAVANADVLNVPFFLPSSNFRNKIKEIITNVFVYQKLSQERYLQAQELLLAELSLTNWQPKQSLSFVGQFKESEKAERFDAEYFHPEKYHYLKQLEKLPGESIGYYFRSVRDMLDPTRIIDRHPVYNYDLTDALRFFLDADIEPVKTTELGSLKKKIKNGDVVVSRLRSYLKEIAIVDTPKSLKCVGSSEFIVFRPRSQQVKSEILLVYLRSLPVQSILKWCQMGQIILVLMKESC